MTERDEHAIGDTHGEIRVQTYNRGEWPALRISMKHLDSHVYMVMPPDDARTLAREILRLADVAEEDR